MNIGQFTAIVERLDRLIALLEAQQCKTEAASASAAAQPTAGEDKPKPAPKGKK